MAPDLFRINWDTLGEALALLVVLAFLVERALALVFESEWYVQKSSDRFKEVIAFVVSGLVVWNADFDIVAISLIEEKTTAIGLVITAAAIAGGSKGAVKLFHDVMGVESSASRNRKPKPAPPAPAVAPDDRPGTQQ